MLRVLLAVETQYVKVQICERCEKALETYQTITSTASIGMNVAAYVRHMNGNVAVKEHRQPFWLCLSCAKELQRWVANKEKK